MGVVWMLALLAGQVAVEASTLEANPIRKVVTLLQLMQEKVAAEGKTNEELYEKFMCYVKNGKGALRKSISDAEVRIPELESLIKEEAALKEQLDAELNQHKEDRENARGAIKQATNLRQKQNDKFLAESSTLEQNVAALGKAIPALESGMAGGFLQTKAATILRRLSVSMDMADNDRETLASFLNEGSSNSYAPASGEIVGILKTMHDEMSADLETAKKNEAESVANFEALIAAKEKEIEAAGAAIESKMARVSELAVNGAERLNELEDTKEQLEADKQFLKDLEENAATKEAEWAEYKKMMSAELLALADTIKILNDDDALELFKKTIPSFLQANSGISILKGLKGKIPATHLSMLESALEGAPDFGPVLKMIDDLVEELKKEQGSDDDKKNYCNKAFDETEDEEKNLNRKVSDSNTAIEALKQDIAQAKELIEKTDAAIQRLDKDVAEATEQRKEENAAYKQFLTENNAAKDLLNFAKNRLQKFYNPKLYKEPPARELTEEERIFQNSGGQLAPTPAPGGIAGTGITALAQADPGPAPEGPAAFKKSDSSGVTAMIDNIVADITKELQEAEVNEKNAQSNYETFMADSKAEQAANQDQLENAKSTKADGEADLVAKNEELSSQNNELIALADEIKALHEDCDWLLQNYVARKEARTGEISALGNAKAALSGANYS